MDKPFVSEIRLLRPILLIAWAFGLGWWTWAQRPAPFLGTVFSHLDGRIPFYFEQRSYGETIRGWVNGTSFRIDIESSNCSLIRTNGKTSLIELPFWRLMNSADLERFSGRFQIFLGPLSRPVQNVPRKKWILFDGKICDIYEVNDSVGPHPSTRTYWVWRSNNIPLKMEERKEGTILTARFIITKNFQMPKDQFDLPKDSGAHGSPVHFPNNFLTVQDNVILHEKPNSSSPSAGILNKGADVFSIEDSVPEPKDVSKTWSRILSTSGTFGWVESIRLAPTVIQETDLDNRLTNVYTALNTGRGRRESFRLLGDIEKARIVVKLLLDVKDGQWDSLQALQLLGKDASWALPAYLDFLIDNTRPSPQWVWERKIDAMKSLSEDPQSTLSLLEKRIDTPGPGGDIATNLVASLISVDPRRSTALLKKILLESNGDNSGCTRENIAMSSMLKAWSNQMIMMATDDLKQLLSSALTASRPCLRLAAATNIPISLAPSMIHQLADAFSIEQDPAIVSALAVQLRRLVHTTVSGDVLDSVAIKKEFAVRKASWGIVQSITSGPLINREDSNQLILRLRPISNLAHTREFEIHAPLGNPHAKSWVIFPSDNEIVLFIERDFALPGPYRLFVRERPQNNEGGHVIEDVVPLWVMSGKSVKFNSFREKKS